jgi:hypothetical protein
VLRGCASALLSLSRRTGEGRGEGSCENFSCQPAGFDLPTPPCQPRVRANCASNPLGPRSAFGNYRGRAVWPVTNFAVSIRKGVTTLIAFASKPDSPSNSTVQATDFRTSSNTTPQGTIIWLRAAFSSSECGITNLRNRKAAQILWTTSGGFCRNVRRIRAMLRRRRAAASRTDLKNPHPDALPSDGRGQASAQFWATQVSWVSTDGFRNNHLKTAVDILSSESAGNIQQFSLSRRTGEGRGEGISETFLCRA